MVPKTGGALSFNPQYPTAGGRRRARCQAGPNSGPAEREKRGRRGGGGEWKRKESEEEGLLIELENRGKEMVGQFYELGFR